MDPERKNCQWRMLRLLKNVITIFLFSVLTKKFLSSSILILFLSYYDVLFAGSHSRHQNSSAATIFRRKLRSTCVVTIKFSSVIIFAQGSWYVFSSMCLSILFDQLYYIIAPKHILRLNKFHPYCARSEATSALPHFDVRTADMLGWDSA